MYNSYNQNGNDIDYYTLYMKEGEKEARSAFSRYHLALFLYLLIANLVAVAVQFLIIRLLPEDTVAAITENVYFSWLLGVGPMYLIGLPILLLITRNMKTKEREKKKMSFIEFLSTFAVCQAAMMVGNQIGMYFIMIVENLTGRVIENTTSALIENTPLWLIFLIVVVIGPIIEELIFRKLMIDRLGRFGDTLAIIVSAVSFGLFHGNLSQLFYATTLGFILGYIYVKTGNVWYTTALHMLVNFFGSFVAILFIDVIDKLYFMLEEMESGVQVSISELLQHYMIIGSYSAIQYGLAMAGIAIFCVYAARRRIIIDKNAEFGLSPRSAISAAYLNVGMILFVLCCLASIALSIFL